MDYLSLWSFLAVGLSVAVLTDLLKRILKHLPKNKWVDLITDGRIVPMILAILIGIIPGIPMPEFVSYGIGSILYFGMAGILSTWIFSLLQKIFKELHSSLPQTIKKWLGNIFNSKKEEE